MNEIVIDFSRYANIDAFHDDIAEKLSFPAYYGRNLDALHDLIGAQPAGKWTFLIFYGGSGIPHKQQVTIAKILLGKK